jgi:juxtaposed with another zinc finger protein 1
MWPSGQNGIWKELIEIMFKLPDNDPNVIEQKEQSQPACLPLSYVLRFITDSSTPAPQTPTPITPTTPVTATTVALSTPTRKEQQLPSQQMTQQSPQQPTTATTNTSGTGTEVKRKLAIKHHSYSLSSSNRSTTPTGECRYSFKLLHSVGKFERIPLRNVN